MDPTVIVAIYSLWYLITRIVTIGLGEAYNSYYIKNDEMVIGLALPIVGDLLLPIVNHNTFKRMKAYHRKS